MVNLFFQNGVPEVNIELAVWKGQCAVPEDLSHARVYLWLVNKYDRILVSCSTANGKIMATFVQGQNVDLEPAVYDIKAVWVKDPNIVNKPDNCWNGEWHAKMNEKVCVTEVKNAFIVTSFADDATQGIGNSVRLKFDSRVATYGYDGLSAYETAVLYGVTTALSEKEYVQIRAKFVDTNQIKDKAITTAKIADEAVTTAKMADGAVTTSKIVDNSVITAKIANDAVTAPKIANGAVITEKIVDNAVISAKLADSAVTTGKIVDNAVNENKIANGAVTTGKIANESVTNAKIVDEAVTTDKIADGAVTASHIVDEAVTTDKIADGGVDTDNIADGAVTNAKLAGEAITDDKIADGELLNFETEQSVRLKALEEDVSKAFYKRSGGVGNRLSLVVPVSVEAGIPFSYKVEGSGVTGYVLYVTYEGDEEHTNLGAKSVVGSKVEMVPTRKISSVEIYTNALESACDIVLSVYYDIRKKVTELINKTNENEIYIKAVDGGVYGLDESVSLVSGSARTFNKLYKMVAGETIRYKVDSSAASGYLFYVRYEGDEDYTRISAVHNIGKVYELTLENDIDAVQVYFTGSYVTASGTATLSVYNKDKDLLDDVVKEVGEIEEDIKKSVVTACTSGSRRTISVDVNYNAGSVGSFMVEGSGIGGYVYYLKYRGNADFTAQSHSDVIGEKVDFECEKDVVGIQIYTDAITENCDVKLTAFYELKDNTDKLNSKVSDLWMSSMGFDEDINVSSSRDTYRYLACNIGSGENVFMSFSSAVSSYAYFYFKYKDASEYTPIVSVGAGLSKSVIAENDIVEIRVYIKGSDTTANGTGNVKIYAGLKSNLEVFKSRFNEASSALNLVVGTSPSYRMSYNASAGSTIYCQVDTECASMFMFYVKYVGDADYTRVVVASTNQLVSQRVDRDVEGLQIYFVSSYITSSGQALWRIIPETKMIASEVAALSSMVDSKADKVLSVVAGYGLNSNNSKVEISAKKGDTLKIHVDDADGCLTNAIRAFYYIPKGKTDDDHVNMGLGALTSNETYTYVLPEDCDYVTLYVSNAAGSGNVTFVVESMVGLKQKIENISKVSAGGEGFDAQALEKAETLKRFLPRSIITDETEYLSYSSKRWEKCCNIVCFTDSHIDDAICPALNKENVKDVVNFVNGAKFKAYDRNPNITDEYIFDAVVNCGDAISSSYDKTQQVDVDKAKPFFEITKDFKVPFIYAMGNHDMMIGDRLAEIYGDWAEEKFGLVRQTKSNGNKSTWSYYDIADKKIRVIAVDVQDVERQGRTIVRSDGKTYPIYCGNTAWYIGQEQMSWLIGTALNFDDKTDKDWGVVILTHQSKRMNMQWAGDDNDHNQSWYEYNKFTSDLPVADRFEGDIDKFFEVLKAFNTQGTYSNSYTKASGNYYNININADFTRYSGNVKKPHVVCWLNGHEHVDLDNSVERVWVNGTYRHVICSPNDGINMIWVLQSACMTAYGTPKVVRYEGTSTQNAFDCISIDTKNRKIRIVRYGAGVDCFGKGGDRWLDDGLDY